MTSAASGAAGADFSPRSRRLFGRFKDVTSGKSKVLNQKDALIFIEALMDIQPPSRCVESLMGSAHGLDALRIAVRVDLSLPFIQSQTLNLLKFLSDPSVKALADGHFLWQLLDAITSPPTLWNVVIKAFLENRLNESSLEPFAWLIYELLSSPHSNDPDLLPMAEAILQHGGLSVAKAHETRDLAYKIQNVVKLRALPVSARTSSYTPGGRHDNDFANFGEISIYPTADEFLSSERPFYRSANEVFEAERDDRPAMHLDNQFRLLREDMLAELRSDLQIAVGKRGGKRSAQVLGNLVPTRITFGDDHRAKKCSLAVRCYSGLGDLKRFKNEAQRLQFIKENKNYLKHQSFGALVSGKDVCGFAFIERDESLLAADPPVVCLKFTDNKALGNALLALRGSHGLQFILVDTPVFAYEPVLKVLQTMDSLPLAHTLLSHDTTDGQDFQPPGLIRGFVTYLREKLPSPAGEIELGAITRIDASQRDSLIDILERPVSVVQGPPGTGKTFIGSRAVKILHKHSNLRILIISYTNHALDQSLENLLDIGIPADDIVRLGSKFTPRTQRLRLSEQDSAFKAPKGHWDVVDKLKMSFSLLSDKLTRAFKRYASFTPSFQDIQEYLEFADGCSHFHEAFIVPTGDTGWRNVGNKGREVKPDYLFSRWSHGGNPGVFTKQVSKALEPVWDMHPQLRQEHLNKWVEALIQERVQDVRELVGELDKIQEQLSRLYERGKTEKLRSKRIISCTTTAAATHMSLLRAAEPDIVLVEEAGEILESHVLTALAPSVKQLILIGDHQQLRPKVKTYHLTVEKGDGFDLNMSLFERLVRHGYPHTTLLKQHRMHPDLSLFPRALTYPALVDGAKTGQRLAVDGLRDRVMFVNHEHPETTDPAIGDRLDGGAKASKQNNFEAVMVLRLVRYLAQQGYGTDKMVVLTPYLGQLRLLRDTLKNENDPVLNDLDASDLLRAGLVTHAAAKLSKRPLRISTIDNYQGEESDIVIASLTRGNTKGDIGFMAQPERLNVLITRARCCLIMIGNMDTFISSKKGKATWVQYFKLLKENGHLYDGIPVICQRHPTKTAEIKEGTDFDRYCPDGGCSEPCNVTLNCGLHQCKLKCHRFSNHSQTKCTQKIEKTCSRQHKLKVQCSQSGEGCRECLQEDKETERRVKRDLDMERRRLSRQGAYSRELQAIRDELDHERRLMKDLAEAEQEEKTLAKERETLKTMKEAITRQAQAKLAKKGREAKLANKADNSAAPDIACPPSNAREEWEQLKDLEGAQGAPLDELMGMIGLEEVKETFLNIKTTIDTKLRQNVALESQRYGACLLGNPGTGKTTVARLYAKFLTSIGAIAGSRFEETTGSKLANMGVQGCQRLIDDMLNDDGGVLFIDEAYQLTSGNNPGGAAVLDFLLAEVENLTGKIVFVLAGYSKQMESFSAHNPGLPSRFPYEMRFADYSDDELLRILGLKIHQLYSGAMKCQDGPAGLFCRIVARRIGRGRGQNGFGNARAVENNLAVISQRQAARLRRERLRGKGAKPDDFLLTKEDLIGPEPSVTLAKSTGWQGLLKLYGLRSVKDSVRSLVSSVQQNYQRELAEQPPIEYSLNKVFLGNPGTGKTTVAKLYGQILVDLGMLSKGEVVVKNPSDFVGSAMGQSEEKTKGILASTVGKVLVIDEAYGLYGGGGNVGGQGSNIDPYKTAVVDTIVAEVQSVPGDDRCVLLLGYKQELEKMFQNVNPGLSRRFPMASAFTFDDFSDDELRQILDLKLKQQGFQVTDQARTVAIEMLGRARNRPNFGNAGEIDIILGRTKERHQARLDRGQAQSATLLEAIDFDEDFARAERSDTNVRQLFVGTVGAEDIVAKLEGYQSAVRTAKTLGLDPKENVPFSFLFRGPPGTGKTTTAKKMGKVFYDMGFLANAEVVECSASDLIGQFVGQTGPKVLQLLDKALGKVLFIDEAYRLAEGHFAKEAMDELVDSATKERYHKRLVVILAGYERDINRLMSANAGLTSRFPEVIDFRDLEPAECVALLGMRLASQRARIRQGGSGISLDLSVLEQPASPSFAAQLTGLFSELRAQANWANARDVETLARAIFTRSSKSAADMEARRLVVREEDVLAELGSLLRERASRARAAADSTPALDLSRLLRSAAPPKTRTTTATATTTTTAAATAAQAKSAAPALSPLAQALVAAKKATEQKSPLPRRAAPKEGDPRRDAGVSDAVWEQLQRDRQAEKEREEEYRRLADEAGRAASEADRERIVKRLLEEEDLRKREEAMRARLAAMGVCPVGYSWIKQASGYRCAGGSHYMSDAELGGS